MATISPPRQTSKKHRPSRVERSKELLRASGFTFDAGFDDAPSVIKVAKVVEMGPPASPPQIVRSQMERTGSGALFLHDSPKTRSRAAREAYGARNSAMSISTHDNIARESAKEAHSQIGGYVKSIVFGGLDGIITTFAVISGAVGGGLSVEAILILGFSSLIADGFSMGFGDALSSKAENEYILSEKRREEWEFDNYKEGEIQEMVELYNERGMAPEDAECVIRRMSKYRDFFVDIMMKEELELQVPGEDDSPWKDGFVTFVSFLTFGMVPLLVYAVAGTTGALSESMMFIISCCLTAVTFVVLGCLKAYVSGQSMFRGAFEVLSMGTFAAGIAYSIGFVVHDLLGIEI